jgi:hypothetical protein
MEPITLCGAVIVMFGLWVEFEPAVKAIIRVVCRTRLVAEMMSHSTVQRPAYVRRMPICVAKTSHY